MWSHLRVSFAHETSINSERWQNQSIFFLHLSHSGRWSLKKVFCAKLCRFLSHFCCYIQKQYMNQAFCKKRKLSLSVYACFACKWNNEMRSQSQLDPFSCIVVHVPKKRPTSYFGEVKHLKEKSRAKNYFTKVIRAVVKVYLCQKNLQGYWHCRLQLESS